MASARPRYPARFEVDAVDFSRVHALAQNGNRVRWLLPWNQEPGPQPPAAEIELRLVPTQRPGFRDVERALLDPAMEQALVEAIRNHRPDIVHIRELGGGSAAWLPWLAQRLGIPSVVEANPLTALCHRGTLVDATNRPCQVHDDPVRCVACCLTPHPLGLSRSGALVAKGLKFLGGLSPFPNPTRFANRLDIVLGGLTAADLVLVHDTVAAQMFESAGVAVKSLRVVGPTPPDGTQLLQIYHEVVKRSLVEVTP